MNATERRLLKAAPRDATISASYGDGRTHRGVVRGVPRKVGKRWVITVDCTDGTPRPFGLSDIERAMGRVG